MNLFLLCALCILTYCSSLPQAPSGSGADHGYKPIYLSTIYGKVMQSPEGARSSFGRSSADLCSGECMVRMMQDIQGDEEFNEFVEKQSKPVRFGKQFDQKMLNKYCTKMNGTIDCVTPCAEGQTKQVSMKALSLAKYMCIETRFVEHAVCYNKIAQRMESMCNAIDKCSDKKTALEGDLNKPVSGKRNIETLFKNTCDYMHCFNDCERSTIVQECGAEANSVLEGLFKKSIDVLRDMFQIMRIDIDMPRECNRVGSGTEEEEE